MPLIKPNVSSNIISQRSIVEMMCRPRPPPAATLRYSARDKSGQAGRARSRPPLPNCIGPGGGGAQPTPAVASPLHHVGHPTLTVPSRAQQHKRGGRQTTRAPARDDLPRSVRRAALVSARPASSRAWGRPIRSSLAAAPLPCIVAAGPGSDRDRCAAPHAARRPREAPRS
jgi:hypothetical protein